MSKSISPDTIIGHYRVVSQIGAGGMGEVYLARDTKLDRKVALKILPTDVASNHDRMERFVREAKSAAALSHPKEFVDGVTLRQKIHSERTELRTLLRHLQHVAEGLAKAHAMGIVHRDLKPDNIMITHDGHAKILDFGLAKLLETRPESADESGEAATAMMPVQHSTPGVVMGTVGYMSPEQAKAKPVDQRSDVFSFGCLLYEAATGHKPFDGDSPFDTLHKIVYDPAPAISDHNPAAPAELQRIIRKCLAKEPAKRYQTIRDVANDLDELIEELKGRSDIERSVAPSSQSQHAATSGVAVATTADSGRVQSIPSLSQPASSAEFIATGIRQHKLGVALLLAILVGAISVLGYYLYSRSNKRTIGSIAVLPFQNRNSDADTEYLSDGLAESLIYRLSQLPNLKVSPTSSVLRYKGQAVDAQKIAAELNVDAVMSGVSSTSAR